MQHRVTAIHSTEFFLKQLTRGQAIAQHDHSGLQGWWHSLPDHRYATLDVGSGWLISPCGTCAERVVVVAALVLLGTWAPGLNYWYAPDSMARLIARADLTADRTDSPVQLRYKVLLLTYDSCFHGLSRRSPMVC